MEFTFQVECFLFNDFKDIQTVIHSLFVLCKPSKVQVQFVDGTAVVKSGSESRPSAAEGDLTDVFETKEGYMDVTTLSLGVNQWSG